MCIVTYSSVYAIHQHSKSYNQNLTDPWKRTLHYATWWCCWHRPRPRRQVLHIVSRECIPECIKMYVQKSQLTTLLHKPGEGSHSYQNCATLCKRERKEGADHCKLLRVQLSVSVKVGEVPDLPESVHREFGGHHDRPCLLPRQLPSYWVHTLWRGHGKHSVCIYFI